MQLSITIGIVLLIAFIIASRFIIGIFFWLCYLWSYHYLQHSMILADKPVYQTPKAEELEHGLPAF